MPDTLRPPRATSAPEPVRQRLAQLVRRIRALQLLAGLGRMLALLVGSVVGLYLIDRYLVVPTSVRALLEAGALLLLGRQTWIFVLRPLVRGPDALDAARLVEQVLGTFEGRLVSVLQLPSGAQGSFEQRVAEEAAAACAAQDLRGVLRARAPLREAARGAAALAGALLLVFVADPPLDVFGRRLLLQDVSWPRDTRLRLVVPESSPVHVRRPDGALVVSRGGTLNVQAEWEGRRPEGVELVVVGADGPRPSLMAEGTGERYLGAVTARAGDRELFARGGDDDGRQTRLFLEVVEPPRLDDPRFVLEPPAYLGVPPQSVGAEGLVVSEGTRVLVDGRPRGEPLAAELLLGARAEPVPLRLERDEQGLAVRGEFVAEESDTLSIVLTGAWGLATPDPSHHALLVRKDRPPGLRVFAPGRSDVKVTARALVPIAVVAEDDHGVAAVTFERSGGAPLPLTRDPLASQQFRHVLDLGALDLLSLGLGGGLTYALAAADGRDLPGRGPQQARVEGRRIDVVDDAEVQRLLADRQLRLKEAFTAVRERQLRTQQTVAALLESPAGEAEADLLAAAVGQNQVTSRLLRETRELIAVVDETIWNRLDPGPGAEALLRRRLEDWQRQAVDQAFDAASWRALAQDEQSGRFGRLDTSGRLLAMAALALEASEDLSPAAHERLLEARERPTIAALASAQEAQARVVAVLDRLLERMDEWEDYQEVLGLVKMLIEDQKTIQQRTGKVLQP